MSGTEAIKYYVGICMAVGREPDELEFLAMTMLGVMPKWIEEL